MDDNAKELMKRGNKLFEQKAPFDSLCQEIASHSTARTTKTSSMATCGRRQSTRPVGR